MDITLRAGDSSSLMAQLKLMQVSLSKVVSTVRAGAESVSVASAQISEGNNDLSQRTEEQASALEQTAASLAHSATQLHRQASADNAKQANQLAIGASLVAVEAARAGEQGRGFAVVTRARSWSTRPASRWARSSVRSSA